MGELARATLTALDINGGTLGAPIDVCFNPKEYSLDKQVTWKPMASKGDAHTVEFGEPAPMSLTINLQFDTYEERISVRDKYVRQIENLTLVSGPQTVNSGGGDQSVVTPPMVLFTWGNFRFKGVVESLTQKYTMFLQDGTPVRADCTIKIKNALDAKEIANGGASDGAREIAVTKGMTPDAAATAAYGDPTQWKQLMDANDIDDPLNFSGTVTVKK